MVAWRYEISLLVLKKIFHSFAAPTRQIFFNARSLEEKFRISARPCNILYLRLRHTGLFCRSPAAFHTHTMLNIHCNMLKTHNNINGSIFDCGNLRGSTTVWQASWCLKRFSAASEFIFFATGLIFPRYFLRALSRKRKIFNFTQFIKRLMIAGKTTHFSRQKSLSTNLRWVKDVLFLRIFSNVHIFQAIAMRLFKRSLNQGLFTRAPLTGLNFALGSHEKFRPGFRDEKRLKILGTSSGAKFEKQSKHGEIQKF